MEIPMLKKLRNSHKKPHTAKQNVNRTNLCGQHKKPPYAGI